MKEEPVIYVREIKKGDEYNQVVASWLDKDDHHRATGRTIDELFSPGTQAALVYDEIGPLMAARFHRALRIAMQFDSEHPYRTAKVAKEVVKWFKELAKAGNFNEIIIRAGGPAIPFAKKLGFDDFDGQFLTL